MAQRLLKVLVPLAAVLVCVAIAWAGVALVPGQLAFGVIIPYIAMIIFVVGFVYRIVNWGRSAVPFRIPTTSGQQKSLPWIKQSKIDNPSSTAGVVGRMALEVLFFRSLFNTSKTEKRGDQLGFGSAKWLWFFGLVFHWSFLIILLRHLRLFFEPVPGVIVGLEALDTFLQVGIPLIYITDVLFLGALTFLFLRRVVVPRIRYISLPADYFALFLLLAIALSGILMRYVFKVDMVAVKEMTMGLVTLHPRVVSGIEPIFYIHLFMVSVLLLYFPWSKLMHAGGVFLAPTRNLRANSREVRHVNPWNYPVQVHSYAEYEDEFRAKMIKVGVPTDYDLDGNRIAQAADVAHTEFLGVQAGVPDAQAKQAVKDAEHALLTSEPSALSSKSGEALSQKSSDHPSEAGEE